MSIEALLKAYRERLMEVLPSIGWHPSDGESTRWWAGYDDPEAVAITSILVQQSMWESVAIVYDKLMKDDLGSLAAINACELSTLSEGLRPLGMRLEKAKRLKSLASLVVSRGGWMPFIKRDTYEVRGELLSLHGIGYETADSILLFAGNHKIFPASRPVERVLGRFGVLLPRGYEKVRIFIGERLPADLFSYKLFYASSLAVSKLYCGSKIVRCESCRINDICREHTSHRKEAPEPHR